MRLCLGSNNNVFLKKYYNVTLKNSYQFQDVLHFQEKLSDLRWRQQMGSN